MNKFFKEKGIAILLLSVIFTFSALFWTSDIVNNQDELRGAIPPPTPLNMIPEGIVPLPVDGNELRDMIPPDLPDPNSEEMRLWRQNEWDKRIHESLGGSVFQVKGPGTLDMPFTIGEEKEIISDVQVAYLGKWDSPNSFSFIESDQNNCDLFTCYGDSYQYDVLSKKYKQIPDNSDDWVVSPNGKIALSYEQGTTKEPTETLGVFRIKNMETGDVRELGKSVRSTCYDGSCPKSCLWAFAWSPDSKNIAMLDWCNYDAGIGGPTVKVLSTDAKDISERSFLRYTTYREIERPKGEKLIFWSPDSTKLYARDNLLVR